MATLLLPTWIVSDVSKAEKVKAADFEDEYYYGKAPGAYADYGLWTTYGGGTYGPTRYSTSTDPNDYAQWNFSPSVTGEYQVDVSWMIWDTQTTQAQYVVNDNNGDNLAPFINMKADNNEVIQSNGNLSGYKNIGTYEFTAGEDYYVQLLASPSGHVHGDAIRINHKNILPEIPKLITPEDNLIFDNNSVDLDWGEVVDEDGDSPIEYELSLESEPIVANGTNTEYNTGSMSLTDGVYSWKVRSFDGYGYSLWSDTKTIVIDTTSPHKPTGLTSSLVQSEVTLNWNDSIDDTTEVVGYNVYRSDKLAKINDSLVTSTSYKDKLAAVGTYTYTVTAVDEAGWESDKSDPTSRTILNVAPNAPVATISILEKEIIVSWKGVGGGVENYVVYVGTTPQTPVAVLGDDTGVDYEQKILVNNYGDYDVYVEAENIAGSTKSNVVVASIASPQTVATVEPALAVTTTVVPETANAADEEDSEDITDEEALDEEGKIKGEEDEDAEENGDINWTPWIILFILIILAGAATGGYFYWFADEDETETKTREQKKPKKSKTKKSSKKSTTKKRRW